MHNQIPDIDVGKSDIYNICKSF